MGARPEREIRLAGVGFHYGEAPVLDGLDLVLPAGRSVGLVGVNGAGKTTLVRLLAGLLEPTAGAILVDGAPLPTLDRRDWQGRVALVQQRPLQLPASVRENVTARLGEQKGPDPFCSRALRRACARADATALIERLPQGWDTVLSPRYAGGVELSGGQWQRIALARALYAVERGARLLVLDEPTAQLDVRREAAFYDRFLELTHGVTTLVISHRFSSVRRADAIAVLDGGRIVEHGPHAALLAAGGRYAQLHELQAARFR